MTKIDMHITSGERKSVMPYQFDGRNIRIIERDGEYWFVASDVAAELGYSVAKDMARRLDDDERGGHIVPTPSGDQEMTIISEPGLYRAIIQRRSTKKMDDRLLNRIARFQRWVFHDVLPSIRKTGGYNAQPSITIADLTANPHMLLQLTQGYALQIEDMKREMGVMEKEVATLDRIAGADNLFGVRVAAKILQMEEKKFTAYIQQIGWAYRQPGTRVLLCYAEKQKAGLVLNKASPYTKPDGSEGLRESLKFTAKGIVRLGKMLNIDIVEGDLFGPKGEPA
ncbi:antirepressor [Brucella endophytica]|uniref:Antirepressor n=1 Tax=Brucella endophytica TaxID=1963359 RepID=A0A916SH57_9HYPH|nr:phage antirepressor KilAC domain-containing protein [Brucella endophytica]GGB00670.1 antirepressor [Brucella endophytica]